MLIEYIKKYASSDKTYAFYHLVDGRLETVKRVCGGEVKMSIGADAMNDTGNKIYYLDNMYVDHYNHRIEQLNILAS